tara:strand:+ start:595 stop:903 length:309 start_codon:yes stop_codon:yes gene_type:complete
MKKVSEKIQKLLEDIPSLRDDDQRLACHIWFRELESMNIKPHNDAIVDFLRLYSKNKLTLGPTIKRARAKLQEENVELRGAKYYIRKKIYQPKWRKDLGYNE